MNAFIEENRAIAHGELTANTDACKDRRIAQTNAVKPLLVCLFGKNDRKS
jgi:hypothetical protein